MKKIAAQNTIVTACNSAYFWGAYLLLASIRYNGSCCPIIVSAHGLSSQKVWALKQFGDVTVVESSKSSPHLYKPQVLMLAKTEYISWIDADCIFVGDLEQKLIPSNQSMQIRFRQSEENYSVFKSRMARNDKTGKIPQAILKQWRKDVGERQQGRYSGQCVTNCFSFHRKHLSFIKRWQQQIDKTSASAAEPVDNSNFAYFMSDESVMASLLNYLDEVPDIADYQLDQKASEHLMHFGMRGKPWTHWRHSHLNYYCTIQQILQWVETAGYWRPILPLSLQPQYRAVSFLLARINRIGEEIRARLFDSFKPLYYRRFPKSLLKFSSPIYGGRQGADV
ncbi:MAG: hypothetical protein HRU20_26765 [Pseudomonadales bacterium]|nr:hypothetical protein [Pseudomonadales bacterium]